MAIRRMRARVEIVILADVDDEDHMGNSRLVNEDLVNELERGVAEDIPYERPEPGDLLQTIHEVTVVGIRMDVA